MQGWIWGCRESQTDRPLGWIVPGPLLSNSPPCQLPPAPERGDSSRPELCTPGRGLEADRGALQASSRTPGVPPTSSRPCGSGGPGRGSGSGGRGGLPLSCFFASTPGPIARGSAARGSRRGAPLHPHIQTRAPLLTAVGEDRQDLPHGPPRACIGTPAHSGHAARLGLGPTALISAAPTTPAPPPSPPQAASSRQAPLLSRRRRRPLLRSARPGRAGPRAAENHCGAGRGRGHRGRDQSREGKGVVNSEGAWL